MSHSLRFAPPDEFLAEITQRTLMGLFLLRPSKRLNELIIGVIAKAQAAYPVNIVSLAVPSNHMHLLATATSQKDLSSFMNFVSSNIAREAGRLHGWKGKLWARRFDCVPVSDEEKAQVERLKYCLSQGCKEGLTASPRDWPGLNAAEALMTGGDLHGVWVDRTSLYNARRKKGGEKLQSTDFEEEFDVELISLPCWSHLSPREQQARARDLVEEIEQETAAMHAENNTQPLGHEAVLKQDPLHRPEQELQTSPIPRVHAASRAARLKFLEAYRIFVKAYRAASAKLRSGDLQAEFPEGSFPPALPFVPALKPG